MYKHSAPQPRPVRGSTEHSHAKIKLPITKLLITGIRIKKTVSKSCIRNRFIAQYQSKIIHKAKILFEKINNFTRALKLHNCLWSTSMIWIFWKHDTTTLYGRFKYVIIQQINSINITLKLLNTWHYYIQHKKRSSLFCRTLYDIWTIIF